MDISRKGNKKPLKQFNSVVGWFALPIITTEYDKSSSVVQEY